MKKSIPIFYDTRMNAVSGSDISPSASKPQKFIQALQDQHFPIEIVPFEPVKREDFYTIHDKVHVDDILDCKKPNGFNTISKDVSDSLYWTSGSMVAACLKASPGSYSFSPTSGAHHATHDEAMGFCTFNSIMLGCVKLLEAGKRPCVIDVDCHFANGGVDIINHYNLHDKIYHFTFGQYFTEKKHAQKYLDAFTNIRLELLRFKPDVIIYNGGVDCHEKDSLGQGFLSTEQMWLRDFKMFTIAKELNAGIVCALAGGYQVEKDGSIPKVLELHLNTVRALQKVYKIDNDNDDGSTKIYKRKNQ